MIFLTVGTQFGFDRLVRSVDEIVESGVVKDAVFAQIGPGKYLPRYMEYVESMEKDKFDSLINSSQAMISHAGMGNISLALQNRKPLLVLPRLKRYGEVVNDHQVDTAQKYEQLGHLLVAYEESELKQKILQLKEFVPKVRIPNQEGVIERISNFLGCL